VVGLLLSCRGIIPGIEYVSTLGGQKDKALLNKDVEAAKKRFSGRELKGRTLGVLGLGAIGSMVAEIALQMEMEVVGFDPALSVDAAWRLSRRVQKMENMQSLFSRSDIVSLHVPMLDSTRGLINTEHLSYFREGAVLLNYAREEIVDEPAVLAALASGRLSQYICDFPTPGLIGHRGVIATPHLGASTGEAEDNCAIMVADQIVDFLENGNIRNSVNFPTLVLERSGHGVRLAMANRNVPRILGKTLSILADRDINVIDMLNRSRDDIAYNLIDIEAEASEEVVAAIQAIDGVINVRVFS